MEDKLGVNEEVRQGLKMIDEGGHLHIKKWIHLRGI